MLAKKIPKEEEFIERGFGLDIEHDPDEAEFSYIRTYAGRTLRIGILAWSDTQVSVIITEGERTLANVALSGVTHLAFQGWDSGRIVRAASRHFDLRIGYDPLPDVHLSIKDDEETP